MKIAVSIANVRALDMSQIASDLVRQGHSEDYADRAVELYRQFLETVANNPTTCLVPTKAIDEAWHAHMLRPQSYVADCAVCFGRLINHEPGVYRTPRPMRRRTN
ncbi:glycine-rich domain-containing protein-like [Azospirillum brasilense]|uniref:glycine-rich domain-containing protein-like n=1 Tax=Azospirillum argentinense TaxID=2970906 RepID=UPI00190DA93B|nr:glycine-rich domain-containing protein-like [Azospirillum argentinense]MBK3798262.1 glycine-rich domain-containing protein-like [Azospirillum argentinense]